MTPWIGRAPFKYLTIFNENFPESKVLYLKFDFFNTIESKIKMFNKISKFIGLKKVSTDSIDLNVLNNKASTYRNKIFRDLLYSNNSIKNFLI